MYRPAASILLLLACSAVTYALPEHWLRISTPHFEMYTTNSEEQAIEELRTFEQVRSFFVQRNGAKAVSAVLVRIVAFRSEQEYAAYSPNQSAFAYYEQGRNGEYIVVQDITPEHRAAAIHEFTHMVLAHAGLKLPVWLNEGLADLYSTLEFQGDQAIVGLAPPGRMYTLRAERWLPLDEIFAVDQNSPDYNQRERASIFYAESWALTHMLQFGDAYAPHFDHFLDMIAAGAATPQALSLAFGKTPAEVYSALQTYVRQDRLNTAAYRMRLQAGNLPVQTAEPSDFEIKLVLAQMLASNPWKKPEAQVRLKALAAEYPQSPEPEEALGYLAWQQHQPLQARTYFTAAVARGSNDAEMIAYLAAIERSTGGPDSDVLALLQKAMALNPDDYNTRLHVGLLAVSQGQFALAEAAFAGLKEIKPGDTYPVFMALAYMQAQRKNLPGARSYAEKAEECAARPDQRLAAQRILDYANAVIN